LNTFIRSANADALCKTTWVASNAYQYADACIWSLGDTYLAQYKACLDTVGADTDFVPTGDAATNYKPLLAAQLACYATVNAVATSDCAAKAATPTGEDDGEDDGEDSSSLLTFSAMLLLVLSALVF